MFLQRLSYFTRKTFLNIRSYPLVNLLSVATVAAAVFIFSAYLLFFINLTDLLAGIGEKVHITAYISDSISKDRTGGIRREIMAIKEVDDVTYISKEDALAYLKESFRDQADILQGLDDNPLPASFEVTLKEEYRAPEDVRLTADKIGRLSGIDDVIYAREWLSKFHEFVTFVKAAGIAGGIILTLTAVAIISNTLKLIILSRRQEIEIMKLVGATNAFIKIPIIIEGMVVGLLGSTAAIVALYFLFNYLMEHSAQSLSLFIGTGALCFFPPLITTAIIVSGIFIGMTGSLLSFGRLLRV